MNYFLRLPCKQGEYPHRKPGAQRDFAASVHALALLPSSLRILHRLVNVSRGKVDGALNPGLSTGVSSLILRSTGVERERRRRADERERERGENGKKRKNVRESVPLRDVTQRDPEQTLPFPPDDRDDRVDSTPRLENLIFSLVPRLEPFVLFLQLAAVPSHPPSCSNCRASSST